LSGEALLSGAGAAAPSVIGRCPLHATPTDEQTAVVTEVGRPPGLRSSSGHAVLDHGLEVERLELLA